MLRRVMILSTPVKSRLILTSSTTPSMANGPLDTFYFLMCPCSCDHWPLEPSDHDIVRPVIIGTVRWCHHFSHLGELSLQKWHGFWSAL